jgi:hypothetical protein
MISRVLSLLFLCVTFVSHSQDYGGLRKIEKEQLERDFELLKQGIEKHHSGLYWYTPKDSVDKAFSNGLEEIQSDLNEIEFFKTVSPIVSLTREDHTNISFSNETVKFLNEEASYFPFKIVFLDKKMYITEEYSQNVLGLVGQEIIEINGKTPIELVSLLGKYYASDGFIKPVKFSDLEGFQFAYYYFIEFGFLESINVKYLDSNNSVKELEVQAIKRPAIIQNLRSRNQKRVSTAKETKVQKESLEFKILNDTVAYLAVHTFSNDSYKENTLNKNYKTFLKNSFRTIGEKGIRNLIIDVSQNSGGNEGNENLLYSYIGKNYRKYNAVCAKSQTSVLNNGVDKSIKLKTFGFFERVLYNIKMADDSYCRKENPGLGLMAYKKEPANKFFGKIYVIISPVTYSGGSEFSNMVRTNNLATFVGEETGGGYYGNTSGYSSKLELPHSKLKIYIPALKFDMNVSGIPFGRGVIPDFKVIPSIEEYLNNENVPLKFILRAKVD